MTTPPGDQPAPVIGGGGAVRYSTLGVMTHDRLQAAAELKPHPDIERASL